MRSPLPIIKFGTDGWRAIMGEEFTRENVRLVIQAFADYLTACHPERSEGSPGLREILRSAQNDKTVYVGYDRRRDSDLFAQDLASVLCANGIKVKLASSFCPSPCIAWMTKTNRATAGVMVTASHNPPQWNGIKFKESYGGAASPELTGAVETILTDNIKKNLQPSVMDLTEARKKGLLEDFDPLADYVETLKSHLSLQKIKSCGWQICFDPLFGAGTGFLQAVLGNDVLMIHGEKDPSFGGLNPEPIENNLKTLIQTVREKHLDVGLATDGDADRIGAVDEDGHFMDSHHIFALILKHLVTVKGKSGAVIKTVSTSNMIAKLCAQYKLPLHETPIGFKYLCKKLTELENPLMAGEESGGIALCNHVYERDGVLSGLMLLEIMSHHKKRLGTLIRELHNEVGPHFFERNDLHLKQDEIQAVRQKLPSLTVPTIAGVKVTQIQRLDGCKFHLADGSWLLIRPSGTEPLLRLYAEAREPQEVGKLLQAARNLL